jgi:D-alanyl-D-alanine carboxypeptidase
MQENIFITWNTVSSRAMSLCARRRRTAMELRNKSHTRLAVVIAVALAAAVTLGTAPAVAARRARRAAGAKTPSAVPLSQIHVLGDHPAPFGLDAKSAMMVDARSGAVLYAYNERDR